MSRYDDADRDSDNNPYARILITPDEKQALANRYAPPTTTHTRAHATHYAVNTRTQKQQDKKSMASLPLQSFPPQSFSVEPEEGLIYSYPLDELDSNTLIPLKGAYHLTAEEKELQRKLEASAELTRAMLAEEAKAKPLPTISPNSKLRETPKIGKFPGYTAS